VGYLQVCLDKFIICECAGVFKIVKGRQHSSASVGEDHGQKIVCAPAGVFNVI